MIKQKLPLLASCLLATLAPSAFAAAITFSGATAFNANASGAWGHNGITATSACCQSIGVEQTTFTGNAANDVALPLTLSLGTNTLYFESGDWTAGFGVNTGGVNLFFDGNGNANISAHTTPTFDQTVFPGFTVTAAGLTTASLTNSDITSAGSLSYDDGNFTVTLTGLQWVGGSGANPYNAADTVQKVTLLVTADGGAKTPEPGSMLLMGAGLAGLMMIYRKR